MKRSSPASADTTGELPPAKHLKVGPGRQEGEKGSVAEDEALVEEMNGDSDVDWEQTPEDLLCESVLQSLSPFSGNTLHISFPPTIAESSRSSESSLSSSAVASLHAPSAASDCCFLIDTAPTLHEIISSLFSTSILEESDVVIAIEPLLCDPILMVEKMRPDASLVLLTQDCHTGSSVISQLKETLVLVESSERIGLKLPNIVGDSSSTKTTSIRRSEDVSIFIFHKPLQPESEHSSTTAPEGDKSSKGNDHQSRTRRLVNSLPTGPLFLDRDLDFDEISTQQKAADVATEESILNSITVSHSISDRQHGYLSEESRKKVVEVVRKYGVCIIEGMFEESMVHHWGEAVSLDTDEIMDAVKKNHGIDLMKNGGVKDEASIVHNFHEVSTREALRFDIRNGKRMARLREQDSSSLLSEKEPIAPQTFFGKDPAIIAIIKDLFNPASEFSSGNWGRHNFEGQGTGIQPEPAISNGGAVVSEPGALSQKIHADTPHLFENIHCAPHYVNLFVPVVVDPSDTKVGQTGFFVGTHKLECSARLVASSRQSPSDLKEFRSRLVRPHIRTGDCVLFDTRILHFGLANISVDTRRIILYVNYTQHWFARKRTDKNWGRISVFK